MSCTVVSQVRARQKVISKLLNDCASKDFFTTFTASSHWPFRISNDAQSLCRILVLDSSFNPPTNAHTKLIERSIDAYPANFFDGSLLLFSTNNVDKTLTGASVLQRAQMMEILALQSRHNNTAVGFTPYGRFVDKASHIQAWFNTTYQHQQLDPYFILGHDTVVRLLDPKYYDCSVKEALAPFFKTCHLICADRGASSEDDAFWNQIQKEYPITRIQLDPKTSELSSTLAKSVICSKDQTGLDQILDPSVVEFIQSQGNQIYINE
jgi:nicotinic acid mononucleotide adenylyltransferase